jgi:ribulose-5-phosphate 4-epimerase/fuculose-1-phosphate aldolase
LLTVGESSAEAFLSMYLLERACRIQILAQSGDGDLHCVPKAIIDLTAKQMSAVTVGQGAELTWPGLLRKLDRIDSSFRD